MKRLLPLLAFLALLTPMEAQNWASFGKFNNAPRIVWYDSVEQKLYAAGNYTWFDSTEVHGFGYIQGDTLIGLGCGFEINCGAAVQYISNVPYVTGFARYKGDMYVTGWFHKAGGVTVNGIAKWGGSDWVPVGTGLAYPGSTTGVGHGLKTMGDYLYVYGGFDSINGIEAHSLAKFDGTTWSSVFDFPKFSLTNPNRVFAAEWYQGELYVGGTFYKFGANPPLAALTKWDGTDWVAVGNGFYGNYPSVGVLLTYKHKLIIAGHFNKYQNPGSIPGNAITSWDGHSWDTLRGGLAYRSPGGSADEIVVHQNELYVAGYFDSVGGVPAKNLANWNGDRWCGVWDDNDFDLNSIAFYQDTLYLSIGSGTVGGADSVTKFAKWIGGTFGDSCQLVGMDEPVDFALGITLHPNPAQASFALTLPQGIPSCRYKIHDITGREVLPEASYHTGGPAVEIGNLPAGLYFVEVKARGRTQVIKLLKQ